MESQQLARRRISTISGHFACTDDLSAGATHLLPLNCSSSLSTARPVTRLDNSVHFARQGSSAQGCFMRQASSDQQSFDQNITNSSSTTSPYSRLDNRVIFARQASASQGSFMRQASTQLGNWMQPETIHYNDVNGVISSNALQEGPPLFSRPSKGSVVDFPKQEGGQVFTVPDQPPKFACQNPNSLSRSCGPTISSQNNGKQWSPRMNVEESRRDYTIILELPGVDASDIRVEVNDKILMVTGRGSTKWSSLKCSSGGHGPSITTCHKREISQGPYQVVWNLPPNVNKNNISAELIEGILQVTIPKV